jgi:hypothetical protein
MFIVSILTQRIFSMLTWPLVKHFQTVNGQEVQEEEVNETLSVFGAENFACQKESNQCS